MTVSRRRLLLRVALLAAAVALGAWLARIGRAHVLYLDNRSATVAGREHAAPEAVELAVDGGKPEELERAERTMRQVVGPVHRLAVEARDGSRRRVEREIRLPFAWDAAVVSLPALLDGAAPAAAVTRFEPPPPEEAPAEQMQQQREADVVPHPEPAPPGPR